MFISPKILEDSRWENVRWLLGRSPNPAKTGGRTSANRGVSRFVKCIFRRDEFFEETARGGVGNADLNLGHVHRRADPRKRPGQVKCERVEITRHQEVKGTRGLTALGSPCLLTAKTRS